MFAVNQLPDPAVHSDLIVSVVPYSAFTQRGTRGGLPAMYGWCIASRALCHHGCYVAHLKRVSGRNLSPYVAVVLTQPSTV